MYVILAGGVIGVGLLVCGVSAVSIRGRGRLMFAQVCLGVSVEVIRWPLICYRPRTPPAKTIYI